MHVCNAVKYLSVITNNLVLGGVLHWRWDWGHISSSYNLSSAPFCAEVLWRDKISYLAVHQRSLCFPAVAGHRVNPWVLLGFETVWVKGVFGQHPLLLPPPPQLSLILFKILIILFLSPFLLREFVILLLVVDFFLDSLSLLPVWGGESKKLWNLIVFVVS